MDCLAKQTGLHVCQVKYDSLGFQFEGSESYKNNISLQEGLNFYSKGTMFFRRLFFSVWALCLNRIRCGDCAFDKKRSVHERINLIGASVLQKCTVLFYRKAPQFFLDTIIIFCLSNSLING